MPLLYRILMRLAALAVVMGMLIALFIVFSFGSADDPGTWLFGLIVGAIPAALLAAIAWVVRPPLDRASLRRLWRE